MIRVAPCSRPLVHIALDSLLLLLRNDRPHLRRRIEPGSQHDVVRVVGDALDQTVEDLGMRIQARAGVTDLPGVREDRARRAHRGLVDIRIGQHDHRRLAAQLQRHPFEISRGGANDRATDFGGAGERDFVDAGMLRQRGSGFLADSRQQIEGTVREIQLPGPAARGAVR